MTTFFSTVTDVSEKENHEKNEYCIYSVNRYFNSDEIVHLIELRFTFNKDRVVIDSIQLNRVTSIHFLTIFKLHSLVIL